MTTESPAFRLPSPEELDPDDEWAYWCRRCTPHTPLQGGWPGVLAHWAVVHPGRRTPRRPTRKAPAQPPARLLAPVEPPERPATPAPTRKRSRKPHTASQPALFDLDPEHP